MKFIKSLKIAIRFHIEFHIDGIIECKMGNHAVIIIVAAESLSVRYLLGKSTWLSSFGKR